MVDLGSGLGCLVPMRGWWAADCATTCFVWRVRPWRQTTGDCRHVCVLLKRQPVCLSATPQHAAAALFFASSAHFRSNVHHGTRAIMAFTVSQAPVHNYPTRTYYSPLLTATSLHACAPLGAASHPHPIPFLCRSHASLTLVKADHASDLAIPPPLAPHPCIV